MLKNMSLTFKLALLPAVAIIGLLLFVGFTYKQLSTNDERLVLLESRSYPTLEKADAAIFQFSLLPGLLNSAVAASEVAELDRARTVLGEIATLQQALFSLTQGDPELNAQVGQWQSAVEKYSGNALNSSERLIKGSATFDDLRPNLDRMSSDLQQAQKLASEFRANAMRSFSSSLTKSAPTTAPPSTSASA